MRDFFRNFDANMRDIVSVHTTFGRLMALTNSKGLGDVYSSSVRYRGKWR